MNTTLLLAIVSMMLAATLYTIAVFSERAAGILKPWHLGLFWLGLVFDTFGTTLMSQIAGGWKWDVHGVIGLTAVALMLFHSIWATIALLFKQEACCEASASSACTSGRSGWPPSSAGSSSWRSGRLRQLGARRQRFFQ